MPTPCPRCNKMCSLEGDDPELEDGPSLGGTELAATVVLNLKSACCGEEMRSHTFELSKEINLPEGATDVEVDESDVDVTVDELQVKGPKGKRKGHKVTVVAKVKYKDADGADQTLEETMFEEIAQADMDEV